MIPWIINMLALAVAPSPGSAKWVVDWGDQRCSLVRETGGAAPMTLMVRTVPGAGQAELWLFDPKWSGPTFSSFKPVEIGLQPSGFQVTDYALSVRFQGQKGIAVTNLDEDFLRNLSGAEALIVRRDGRELARVKLPGSARAMASLQACEAAVMRDWGLDPEQIRSLRQRPKPIETPAQWFHSLDYPMEAVRARAAGSVLARLTVGTDGRVGDCVVVEASGHDVLDERTCSLLLKRGRYKPAVSAAGEPVRAMTSVRIHWRLP